MHASRSLGGLGDFQVCCIIDSMDAAKYSWPKSPVMSTKQFAKFNRPRMSCTSLIIHGHLCLTALTPHSLTCNSSRTAELISNGLSFLAHNPERPMDLRHAFVHVQADNACKEAKNQCMARHLAAQVALRKIKGAQLSFLSSGHSHEDIDALFSCLRSWIQRTPEILTPESFRQCLQSFFDQPEHRPYEKYRKVVMMTKFRDWRPGSVSASFEEI